MRLRLSHLPVDPTLASPRSLAHYVIRKTSPGLLAHLGRQGILISLKALFREIHFTFVISPDLDTPTYPEMKDRDWEK